MKGYSEADGLADAPTTTALAEDCAELLGVADGVAAAVAAAEPVIEGYEDGLGRLDAVGKLVEVDDGVARGVLVWLGVGN